MYTERESYNNDNMFCRFLKKIADYWSGISRYQIFIILTAIATLAILLLYKIKSNNTIGAMFNIILLCAAASGIYIFFRLKANNLAAFTFASALLLRICLVFVLENSTPYMTDDVRTRDFPWIRHYDTVLFQADEYFYVYHTQLYKDIPVSEFIKSPEFKEHAYRTSFLMSKILRFFGDELIWSRLVGAFLGAFAAAITCLAAQKFFGKETSSIVSLLAALAPQTAIYSVGFLKEIWIIFAASLMVYGFTAIIRNKKFFSAALPIAAGAIILFWTRVEYGLMFITAVPIAICFRYKNNLAVRTAAVLSVFLLGVIIFAYQYNQLAYKAGSLLDKYTITYKEQRGRIEMMDKIYKSRGPLRFLNIPLALLNPPPKNLDHVFTAENGFYDIATQANIYQWWLLLPFLIIGIIIVISQKTEFLAFLFPYLIAMSSAAMLLGGLQPNLLRYRDSLAPVAFLIIGAGIESFMSDAKLWKRGIILSLYAAFAILAVYFYLI